MNYAILLAGGKGSRTGSKTAKQFRALNGLPIILYPICVLHKSHRFKKIIIVCNSEYVEILWELLESQFKDLTEFSVIKGGETRGQSLVCALSYLQGLNLSSEDKLLVHEAARPALSKEIINTHLATLDMYPATNTLAPVVDLMMTSKDGIVIEGALEKGRVFHGQAPQGYRLGQLMEFFADKDVQLELADDCDLCSIYLSRKAEVGIIEGRRELFKITFEDDFELAELILQREET